VYCSHCGKKVGDAMLFCPFCGEPIVVPEQDEDIRVQPAEDVVHKDAAKPEMAPETEDQGAAPQFQPPAQSKAEAPEHQDDAAAELLDWSRERASRIQEDAWARPELPAELFVPLELDQAEPQKNEQWREEIVRKKQSETSEKKPPSMNREKKTHVQLQGSAPKLDSEAKDARPRPKGQKSRKHSNTLVPPKTMDPDDIFMDEKTAAFDVVDPYDFEPPEDDLEGAFAFEEDDEGSFFMRHLRGIVGLALFVILLLMFVIYAFSKAGQLSLARVNVAWSKDAYSTLGYQNYQAGNYSESALYYERALQRDPNSYIFASSAAMAYLEAGNNDKAAEMLKRCAQIDPTKLEPYIYLLKLYPDAASRPWDITQLLQQGYQRTGDSRLNVTG